MAVQLLDDAAEITVRDSELVGVEDGDSETTYRLRPIAPATAAGVRKRHTTYPVNKLTRQREVREDVEAMLDDLLDLVLVSWDGIVLHGAPVACTREHKLLLDAGRKQALVTLAGRNQVVPAEVREASFRQPAGVV